MSLPSSPWRLKGLAQPHQAIPLGNGLWRGPISSEEQRKSLGEFGLQVHKMLPDGSAAYFLGSKFFADHSIRPTRAELDRMDIGSARWISARIHLGLRAFQKTPAPVSWMAVLNLTPDSFSDGGDLLNSDMDVAKTPLSQAAELAASQGASWLDLGAESTRPGAQPIAPKLQLQRLIPAIETLLPIGVPISIDTRSPEVASECLKVGASMINDISGLADPRLAEVCAKAQCPTVLMHMRGTPATMQGLCQYEHLLGEVADELAISISKGLEAGMKAKNIVLDPGIGFAKTAQQNLELMAQVGAFRALGFPLLVGPSRKSFLAPLIPGKEDAERDCGSAGAAASCAMQGVAILRLHQGTYWDAVHVAGQIAATRTQQPDSTASSSIPTA